ncbi:hypothetical protein HYC85_029670 [Camellia sinensis]|uniref:Uncharacterized protein n=1 Tax=Camellia sinensis TaxID=4442 RepID=A0A7J7FYS0_CAMSI|nr:hypothetical protein HYC85_029670 [Camellia sinensis]
MANLLELFWYEPPEAYLLPNQLEGWGDSESLIRQAHPTLDHLMERSVYLQADPDEDLLFWRLSRDSTRERYIGPTHVVGLAPDIEPPHFLVAPLPVGFAERRGPAYPSSHLRTTTPPPQHIVYTPAVDFTDGASYLETPIRITGREFWGYDHGTPVYVVQIVWSCFGVELSGWEFESSMQSEFPELFHGPVFRGQFP